MKLNLKWQKIESSLYEDVSYEIRPLSMAAYQASISLGSGDNQQFTEMLQVILPDHVRNIQGVTVEDDAGQHNVTVDEVISQSPLMKLGIEILTKLMEISALDGAEEKNSDRPSPKSG